MTNLTGTSLLLVDDHHDTVAMLARAARRRGWDAELALSGEDALALIESHQPRVVVLDEMMPGISGLDVLRAIRARPDLADTKVVFYSAAFDREKQRDARRLGAVAWYVKGVSRLSEVVTTVEDLLLKT